MRKDTLTEWQYGKGAIKLAGKFLMLDRTDINNKNKQTLILGSVLEDLISSKSKNIRKTLEGGVEMWETEIILIPRRKFAFNTEESFFALTPDQMLASGWGNPDNWKKKIFDKKNGK